MCDVPGVLTAQGPRDGTSQLCLGCPQLPIGQGGGLRNAGGSQSPGDPLSGLENEEVLRVRGEFPGQSGGGTWGAGSSEGEALVMSRGKKVLDARGTVGETYRV